MRGNKPNRRGTHMTSKKRVPGTRAQGDGATPPPPPETPSSPWKPASAAHQDEKGDTLAPFPDEGDSTELEPLPSFRLSEGLLTPFQHRFTQEYLLDLNGGKAYQRARSPKVVTDASARVEASRLLANPNITDEIRRLMDERARRTGITVDRVLLKLWDTANADVRELTELHIGSCRFCWGLYNQYQYTDAELQNAQDKHIREEAKRAKAEGQDYVPKEFHEKGGGGFDPKKTPNPECPECWGEGHARPVIHDTRHLSPAAAALFNGITVKRGKEGTSVNVNVQDRATYLRLVAQHLGMLNDKFIRPEDTENPLLTLFKEIQKSAAGTLGVVKADPERRAPALAEAEDVEAREVAPKPTGWRKVK
jgi:phage terminase small subunit